MSKSIKFMGMNIKRIGGITGTGFGNGVIILGKKYFVAVDPAGKEYSYYVKGYYAKNGSIHITESGSLNHETQKTKVS